MSPSDDTSLSRAQQFTTIIVSAGTKAYLVLPFDPNEVWGFKQRHHITGSINGCGIRGALSVEGAQVVLPLGATWRRDTGVEAGVPVTVVLAPEGPQLDTLAPDVVTALAAAPEAEQFFESLATFYRKNYLRWIESAKRPETRQARIAEVITLLLAGQQQR